MRSRQNQRRRHQDGHRASDAGRPRRATRLSGAELARHARNYLAEITGLEPETVTALERHDDGTWRVTVELLEIHRIPETDDLIGSYEAELDETGQLLSYHRVGRYGRSQLQDAQPPPAIDDDSDELIPSTS